MSKKLIFVLVGFFLFFGFNIAHASVIINEVQLNPIGERFIELYNSGDSAVDLTNWYIQRKTQNSEVFSSLITKTDFQNKIINSNSYFVISKSRSNANLIVDSLSLTDFNTIQIKNSSGDIVDKISWENITDGKSLQLISNSWQITTPTPGTQNANTSSNNIIEMGLAASDSSKQTEVKTKVAEIPQIKTKIITNSVAYTGIPTDFSASTLGYSGEILWSGKYFWNFGDGSSKEMNLDRNEKFSHIYYYAGEYEVTLEYYKDLYSVNPETVSKVIIKVVLATVSISRVGDENDFFIELLNNSDYDINISKWILSAQNKTFIFPKNTIIQAKKKMILSPKITGFTVLDKDTLKLLNSQWENVSDFLAPVKLAKIVNKNPVSEITLAKVSGDTKDKLNTVSQDYVPLASDINLESSAIKSVVGDNDDFTYGLFGLLFLLSIGIGGVYYIRIRNRKLVLQGDGNDFEIMDE